MADAAVTAIASGSGATDTDVSKILTAAKALEFELATAKYQMGGKSKTSLDCSYFIYLVLSTVYKEYTYLDSSAIVQSKLFTKRTDGHKPGDVIYFPPSTDRWWSGRPKTLSPNKVFPGHVGIVLDENQWLGMQSSGVGRVRFNDAYFWGTRTAPEFYTYKGAEAANTAYLQHLSRPK